MRVELLPGMTNVVRFPVERREKATLELLFAIEPDVRVVLLNAEAFGLEEPAGNLEECTDAETAEYIANQVPPYGPERERMLRELEQPVLKEAVEACRRAGDARAEVAGAERAVTETAAAGYSGIEALRERVVELACEASIVALRAHVLATEARGVARAVGIARRGEVWAPRDREAEEDLLLEMGRQIAARRGAPRG